MTRLLGAERGYLARELDLVRARVRARGRAIRVVRVVRVKARVVRVGSSWPTRTGGSRCGQRTAGLLRGRVRVGSRFRAGVRVRRRLG